MPKKVDHAGRRLALSMHAVEVIADKGIENLRLVDVARRMGVTTGLVTHYFEDKDAVLAAALEYVAGELVYHSQEDESFTSLDEMYQYFAEILPLDETRRRHWKVWIAFWSRPMTNPVLAEIHQRYNEAFRAQLVPAIKRLQLHDDPASAANTVITVIDAIATHATIEPEYWTPTRQRKQLKFVLASVFES